MDRVKIFVLIGGWGIWGKLGIECLKVVLFSSLILKVISKIIGCEVIFIYVRVSGE